jgi:3-oxoacyl-[acyl-carrier protein] reductase
MIDMLSSKVVLVTGACGLIGQQLVRVILTQNGCVLATDTDTEKAKFLFQSLPSKQVQFAPMDITEAHSIDKAIIFGIEQFGSVDACINSANPLTAKWGTPFEELEIAEIAENLKLQLGGAIVLSQRMMKHFVVLGYGNFVHISSIMGVVAPKFENYEGTFP